MLRVAALAALLAGGCIGVTPPSRPAEAMPELGKASAAWRARGFRFPSRCRDGADEVRLVFAGEAEFRRHCGHCGPGFCRPEDYAPRRYGGELHNVPLCAHDFHRYARCAASCYRGSLGGHVWGIRDIVAIVVHDAVDAELVPDAVTHEALHWLGDCSGRGPDEQHRDPAIWGRDGLERQLRREREGR